MPEAWEDRASLFCAYLVEERQVQSQTIKSYISAIKSILVDDGYSWCDGKILLNLITRGCRLKNDKLRCRLPISQKLLDILIFELKRVLTGQPYLQVLYRALFGLAYYGLMRIGELTESPHSAKARNVHVGTNKDKIMIVLYLSKTHGKHMLPQKIKITALGANCKNEPNGLICPFQGVRDYSRIRGEYYDDEENFFVFSSKEPVKAIHVRTILRNCLEALNLNPMLYNTQSWRIGRASDLLFKHNWPIDRIKSAGRWRSNAVFRYLRN